MPQMTGHAKAIEVGISFGLIKNADVAEAIQACGPTSTPEEHLTWILDEGRIPEKGAAFLSAFMAALRAQAPAPTPELVEVARALQIERDRLDLVWGAYMQKHQTGAPAPLAEEPERVPSRVAAPVPAKPVSLRPLAIALAVAVLGIGAYFGIRWWMGRSEKVEVRVRKENRLKDAEDRLVPVRKLLDSGKPLAADSSEVKGALARLADSQKDFPHHVPFILLEASLREALGQEKLATEAYGRACAEKPEAPAAFAARGVWKWRRWLLVRSFPWGAKELYGMRACRRTGASRALEEGAIADCKKGANDPLAQAVVDASTGRTATLAAKGRDAALLRAHAALGAGRPQAALHELAGLGQGDVAGRILRAAAHLRAGEFDAAIDDASKAIESDDKASAAREVRALARWAHAESLRWQGCDAAVWKQTVQPLLAAASADWKAILYDAEDPAPRFCAARCAIEEADGDVTRGVDPTLTVKDALAEVDSLPKNDAEALALSAQGHLSLVEWKKAAGQDSKAEREKVAADLAAAEAINEKRPEVLIVRGRWERALGREEDARRALEAAKAAAPDDPRIAALLAGKR